MSEAYSTDMVVVYLRLTDLTLSAVRAVELNSDQIRMKISPRGEQFDIHHLNPRLFDILAAMVAEKIQTNGVVALPEWALELDGIAFSSCRVIVTSLGPRELQAMVRIKRAEGDLASLFRDPALVSPAIAYPVGAADHETALRLYEELFIPIQNLAIELDSIASEFPDGYDWKVRNFFQHMRLRIAPFTERYPALLERMKRPEPPSTRLLLQ